MYVRNRCSCRREVGLIYIFGKNMGIPNSESSGKANRACTACTIFAVTRSDVSSGTGKPRVVAVNGCRKSAMYDFGPG